MKDEKINITINGEVKQPIEIVLREGAAEPIKDTVQKYTKVGVITAPFDFSKRIKDKSKALVEYSINEGWIKLYENPTNKEASEVKGLIEKDPALLAFGINKDKYFSGPELIKHARKYAHVFKDINDVKDLISSLQNFDIKFEQTYSKGDDRKGNTDEHVKNALKFHKGEVKTDFTLMVPFFLGAEKVPVDVQIEIELKDSKPSFGFFSLTLETLIQEKTEELINNNVMKFIPGFTVIQIS
jgi:hypothetical protein